jgi:hypothetical protein
MAWVLSSRDQQSSVAVPGQRIDAPGGGDERGRELAVRGVAGGEESPARSGLLSWRHASSAPASSPGGPASPLLKAAAERDQLRREANSGATSGVRPAPARPPSRRWSRDFEIRTRGEKKWFREGVFAKFVLVGWAAGGPPNSGRRE